MIDVTVSSDAQSRVRRRLSEGGSSGNALIGVPSKNRDLKDIICLNDIKGISLMPVLLNIRQRKDFIGTVISGRLSSSEQPLISKWKSLVRNWIDEGTSLIAVPLRDNAFISPEISGNLVISGQPSRLRCCNLPVTDCGTFLIEVSFKFKVFIFCEIVGHVVISRHRLITSSLRTFESSIGKLIRL
jgi:hypothetical protein